jgi:fatty acid desaturase
MSVSQSSEPLIQKVLENVHAPCTAVWRLRLEDVPTEIRTEIRALHRVRPRANLIVIFYPLLWICSVAAMERWPTLFVRIVGVLVIGVSLQAMVIVMHEALHGNLFRRPPLDRWIGFVLALPGFFSISAYKVAHLNHHRYTRTEKDQDELPNYCRTQQQYIALFYSWFIFGTPIYMFIVPWKALAIASPTDRGRVITEYSFMFLIYATAIGFAIGTGHIGWLLWYWLIPVQVAVVLSNVRGLTEHLGTPGKGDVIAKTRTVTSNWLVSFLMLNLNYHLEHHLFPGIPWYNLPRLHQLLKPICQARGADVRHSYLAYAIECLKRGPEPLV